MTNPTPTSPEPVRDELDQEGLQIAASAILGGVPAGYGMTRPEAIAYARAAILAYREWEREQLSHANDCPHWRGKKCTCYQKAPDDA